jgi:TonB-linked SusC/RagA family outer membrane protein
MENKCKNQLLYKIFALSRKIPLTMRISFALLFCVFLQLSAFTGYAQRTRKSMNASNVTIEKVLNEIERNSDYVFLFSDRTVNTSRIVTVRTKERDIRKILNEVFDGTNITYRIVDKQIILKTAQRAPVAKTQQTQQAQQNPSGITVKGNVKAASGESLIGVSIRIKGTANGGAMTDIDGNFIVKVKKGDVLDISYVGYKTKTVTVTSGKDLDIVLQEDNKLLNEVVVTALGIKKEAKALSYNVQQLNSNDIVGVKDANFMNSLNGKIAGVTINSSSSGIGGSARVVMRGTKSISGNNNALYVIDGIPMPSLTTTQPSDLYTGMGQSGDGISMVNPEDIESISVLSGASAAALYGSEAANGVVMITTKRGAKNHFSVNYSNSSQFFNPFIMPEFQHTYGSEVGNYTSWGEKLTTPSSYRQKDFFQTGYNETNSLSLSTGNDKNQTYISMSATNAEGIIQNNDLDRYNFAIRNSASMLNDKLNLDVSAMYMRTTEQNMLAQGQYFNPLVPIYLFPQGDDIAKYQTYERYDADRNFKVQYWPYGDLGMQMQNPYWIINRDMFVNHKNRYMMTGALKYNITKWMNITGRAKVDYSTGVFEKKYNASTSGLFAGDYGAYYKDEDNTTQLYGDIILNINKYINDFSVTANVGTSIQDVRYNYSTLGGNLQSVANLFGFGNLNLSTAKTNQTGYHDNLQAIFGTAQLGWKSMAYVDFTARNDWSSAASYKESRSNKTKNKTKSIFYPSIGVSAILTELLPIKSSILPYLKVRFSYSEVGNSPERYRMNPTYPLVSGYPSTSTNMPNTDLKPERTKSYEVGLASQLFDGKVKFDFAMYKTSTYNQLFNPTLSSTSGYSSFYVNGGRVDNKGIEASLNLKQMLGPVEWNTGLVYSLNRNKIKKLLHNYKAPDGEVINMTDMDMGGTASVKTKLTEGGSMGDIYVTTLKTDEHGYIDVDYTGKTVSVDQNNWVYAGNVNPKYNLGWRNSFDWKGLDLSFLINARVGGRVVSVTQAVMDAYGVSKTSADARDAGGALVNGFRIPAESYYQTIGGGTSGVGSMYVYSATNVRLAELSLSYDVPIQKWVKFVNSMNVSLVGRNLLMFYHKAPYDPELTASTGTYYQGIDYFMQPSLRTLGFAVKLKF